MSSTALIDLPRPTPSAMDLLGSGVPLSLLLDLVLGPRSHELLDAERLPAPRPPAA